MDYKPGDFFIGVIDFFGILLPGAVLLFLRGQWLSQILGLNQTMWVVFFFASYVLGHFLVGAGGVFFPPHRFFLSGHKGHQYKKVKRGIVVASHEDRGKRGGGKKAGASLGKQSIFPASQEPGREPFLLPLCASWQDGAFSSC